MADNQNEHMNEQQADLIPIKNPRSIQSWKLFRPKYMLTFRLCDACLSGLWNNSNKYSTNAERTVVSFELCEKCTTDNCCATDVLAPFKPK